MTDRTEVIGRRIGAALLDFVVIFAMLIVLGVLLGEGETEGAGVSVDLEGGAALLFFVLVLLYYFATEALTGRTLGKRLLGIRVVTMDGGRPNAGQIAVRTVLRIIDGIAFYLVGMIAILATGKRRQRLGDLAARTTVIAG